MGQLGLLALGGLSLAPSLVEGVFPAFGPPPGSSRLGLALLPWLALSGLPGRPVGSPAALLAVALPPTLLGAAIDAAAGMPRDSLVVALGAGLTLAVLWSAGAAAAARRPGRLYPILWTLVVPGLAALRLALVWAPRTAGTAVGDPPLTWVYRASPPVWGHGWTARDGLVEGARPLDPLPLLVAALVVALVLAHRGGKEEA